MGACIIHLRLATGQRPITCPFLNCTLDALIASVTSLELAPALLLRFFRVVYRGTSGEPMTLPVVAAHLVVMMPTTGCHYHRLEMLLPRLQKRDHDTQTWPLDRNLAHVFATVRTTQKQLLHTGTFLHTEVVHGETR